MLKAAAVHRAGPDRQPGPRGAAVGDRKRKSATPAQVALAWLLAQHPWIVPIPGTTKPHRLRENTDAVDLELTPKDNEEITAAADRVDVQGERYPAHMQRWINR
jgi:aryl-alcohol dehydrogenase-like predicted oxidoreductase